MIPEPPFNPDQVYEVDINCIFGDAEFNSRGVINPTTVLELAKSIAERGLDSPVVLQPWSIPNQPKIKFRLVAGYRRLTAHRLNKMKTIRSLVKENLTDIDARVLNLTENLHRQDLNPKQEAHAIGHLKNLGLTQPQVANKIGKSRGWVQERFYLLEMPEAIQDDVAAGLLTLKHVRHMYVMESAEEMYEYAKKVKDQKLFGKKRDVDPNKIRKVNEKRARTREEIFALQDEIREVFGNNMATRALAWAGGEISDLEVYQSLVREAAKAGKWMAIPDGLEGTHARVG